MQLTLMKEHDLYETIQLLESMDKLEFHLIDNSLESLEALVNKNSDLNYVIKNDIGKIIGAILCGFDGQIVTIYSLVVDSRDSNQEKDIKKLLVNKLEKTLYDQKIKNGKFLIFSEDEADHEFWTEMSFSYNEKFKYFSKNIDLRPRICTRAIESFLNDSTKYFIPSYQRGYRWTEIEVRDLLNDIMEFSERRKDENEWYCLQPLIVKEIKEEGEFKHWEIIDGQQRLTTIFLILKYLGCKSKFTLSYETRKKSQEFLEKVTLKQEENKITNIDFEHIYGAYKKIDEWFKQQDENRKEQFKKFFITQTKVIWYCIDDSENAIDVFTRINSGKIPLTNAELIKGLFLNSSNFKTEDLEKIRLIQLGIANEWDNIEYALHDESLWWFINKSRNDLSTRIEFVFKLFVELNNKNVNLDDHYAIFRYFYEEFKKGSDIKEIWLKIKNIFQTFEEWYQDKKLYHKIGYLITFGKRIKEIIRLKEGRNKEEFLKKIDDEIRDILHIKEQGNNNLIALNKEKLEDLVYEDNNVKRELLRKILLLHNIQTILANDNELSRFPFEKYKKENWDIEHIHAKATSIIDIETQKNWIRDNFIEEEGCDEFIHRLENKESFETISNEILLSQYGDNEGYDLRDIDNIANLCLLSDTINRSIKNNGFKMKRKDIIESEKQGMFIPICTRNVFLKYYTENVHGLESWTVKDRLNYRQDIIDKLSGKAGKSDKGSKITNYLE